MMMSGTVCILLEIQNRLPPLEYPTSVAHFGGWLEPPKYPTLLLEILQLPHCLYRIIIESLQFLNQLKITGFNLFNIKKETVVTAGLKGTPDMWLILLLLMVLFSFIQIDY